VITLAGVTFRYGPGPAVLDGVDLELPRGQITAITGRSGRGKSTLLFLAGLLLRPTAGRVLVDGVDVTALPDRRRSAIRGRRIGFVFQDAALDPARSILDNVIESTEYSGTSRVEAAARGRALLADVGVETDPRRRPVQISGGQAQRVALCRALLPRPQAVLADEPTGNLDRESTDVVLRRLRAAADAGAAIVIATHDERVIGVCDERHDLA
jgi:ABC-type lipoprotein export system ATPase subunit